MLLHFYKYHGTGNDFILIDNRQDNFPKNDTKLIRNLCDRHYGIGADGLILLERDHSLDFKMVYYNSDGKPGSMCGNGGRCIVAFAHFLDLVQDKASFSANGDHYKAEIENDIISLSMRDVSDVETHDSHWFVDTGSPHHIEMVEDLDALNVVEKGAKLRYEVYGETGSNINYVSLGSKDTFEVRTYERGVEDETQSCGTGVTAVALAMHHAGKSQSSKIKIKTLGGDLEVHFDGDASGYFNIKLKGPAVQVFKGYLEC